MADWQSLYLQAAAAGDDAEGEPRLIPMPPPASGRRYVCLTCGVVFPTHYALGGHSKIHSHRNACRFPGKKTLQGRFSPFHAIGVMIAKQYQQRRGGAAVESSVGGIPPPSPTAVRELIRHPCSHSGLVFSNSKGIGNHMLMHLQAEMERAEAEAAEASAARPSVPRPDIDLNKPPMEME